MKNIHTIARTVITLLTFFSLTIFPVIKKTKAQRRQSFFNACRQGYSWQMQSFLLEDIERVRNRHSTHLSIKTKNLPVKAFANERQKNDNDKEKKFVFFEKIDPHTRNWRAYSGTKTTALHLNSLLNTCQNGGNSREVNSFLLHGIDPCAPDLHGTPFLFRMIQRWRTKNSILRTLLEHSIERHKDLSTITDAKGNTILHAATGALNLNALEIIVSSTDINPFVVNKQNTTALELAAKKATFFDTTPVIQVLKQYERDYVKRHNLEERKYLAPILGDEIIDADEWLYTNYLEKKARAEERQKKLQESTTV